MRKVLIVAAMVAFAGCSKQRSDTAPPKQLSYGQSYQAPPPRTASETAEPVADSFRNAWERFADATNDNLDTDDYTFERARDGAISIGRSAKRVAGRAAEEVEDAAILTAVKSRLETTRGVMGEGINVDVDDGVVTLRGEVDSRAAAGDAIRLALDTRGVDRVISYLMWSGMKGHEGHQHY
jgi:osmotically-inducible protein OsmY